MSNRGEAWRKFAQTFFLAEQPKGYYILNDIFRYLKEEDEAEEDEERGADHGDVVAPEHEEGVGDEEGDDDEDEPEEDFRTPPASE